MDIQTLHKQGLEDLNGFWAELESLEQDVSQAAADAPEFVQDQFERLEDRIRAFEPNVSVIGQIKAGKSSLVNALVGTPDLLPADVNPWTSVITSLHLNSRSRPANTRALFRFFDSDEWQRLVESGGRLGEMAQRAGFASEFDQVRAQVETMRQTTEARLGDEFTSLLGTSRAFAEIDKSIIDRYICYGDPSELEDGGAQGAYADLTKQADLFVDLPGYPNGICIRDTPGVNDTFMMREQITLNAISESRMCVVVLSAHQALSTMDMALMRIICAIDAREVAIFVNRVDELSDPAREIPQIEANIRKTLGRFGLDDSIEIMFGSGYWAKMALTDGCTTMMAASRAALDLLHPGDDSDLAERALLASGVGALHKAIARRIIDGPGQALLADIRAELGKTATMQDTVKSFNREAKTATPPEEITAKLDSIGSAAIAQFDQEALNLRAHLEERLDRAQHQFVDSAVAVLQSHIDNFGEIDNWSHEPSSLRMVMRSSYTSVMNKLRRLGERCMEDMADGVEEIMVDDLFAETDTDGVDIPSLPQHRPPTALAKTLSFDLGGSWWRKFWRVGAKERAEKRYRAMIIDEITPLRDELITGFYDEAATQTRASVSTFFDDQTRFVHAVMGIAPPASGAPEDDEITQASNVLRLDPKKRNAA